MESVFISERCTCVSTIMLHLPQGHLLLVELGELLFPLCIIVLNIISFCFIIPDEGDVRTSLQVRLH